MQLKKTYSYSQMSDFIIKNSKEAKDLYFEKDMTARQLAEHYSIIYNSNFQKACIRYLGVKGKGLGGARVGAGNIKENREKRRSKKNNEVITLTITLNVLYCIIIKLLNHYRKTNKKSITKRVVKIWQKVDRANCSNACVYDIPYVYLFLTI